MSNDHRYRDEHAQPPGFVPLSQLFSLPKETLDDTPALRAGISRLQSALSALTRKHHELGERESKLRAQVPQWVACSERMPTAMDNWVLAWGPGWSRPRLVNWCCQHGHHWRNEQDDRCYFVSDPTHWQALIPPTTSAEEGGT